MTKLHPIVAVRLKKNSGQTQALAAGIAHAQGEIIVTMDGDLENDPADIPFLLHKLEEGYDIATAWRKNRWKESALRRRLPSALANMLVSWVSGVRLHDHGCNLRAYRKEVFHSLKLTGEMHRMIPAYAIAAGARVAELPVRFEPRRHGVSKYGLSRIFKVLLDIIALHFFHKYAKRPIHFFGGIGFVNLFLGGSAFLSMVFLKYGKGISFIQTPLPILSAFFVIIGFQFILMGLLAEIVVRIPYAERDEPVTEIIHNR
jgi:glycosyltransferase involved in cell wall biosynthesis